MTWADLAAATAAYQQSIIEYRASPEGMRRRAEYRGRDAENAAWWAENLSRGSAARPSGAGYPASISAGGNSAGRT